MTGSRCKKRQKRAIWGKERRHSPCLEKWDRWCTAGPWAKKRPFFGVIRIEARGAWRLKITYPERPGKKERFLRYLSCRYYQGMRFQGWHLPWEIPGQTVSEPWSLIRLSINNKKPHFFSFSLKMKNNILLETSNYFFTFNSNYTRIQYILAWMERVLKYNSKNRLPSSDSYYFFFISAFWNSNVYMHSNVMAVACKKEKPKLLRVLSRIFWGWQICLIESILLALKK